MKKKITSLFLSAVLASSANIGVLAEEVQMESTIIKENLFKQDFENYTVQSSQNSVVTIGENNVLKMHRQTDERANRNNELLKLNPAISDDKIEVSFRVMPQNTAGEQSIFYMQFKQGSAAPLELSFDSRVADKTRYKMVLKPNQLLSETQLVHLDADAQPEEGEFNDIRLVIEDSKVDVYLNGVKQNSEAISFVSYTSDTVLDSILLYQYENFGGNPLNEAVYVDDIEISASRAVEYDPSKLSLSFEASMDYSGEAAQINITEGKVSQWLNQNVKLSLINAEDETNVFEVTEAIAKKCDDGSGEFEFSAELPGNITPGYYYVNAGQWIDDAKKSEKSIKLYVATMEQLNDLPEDLSSLPNDEAEAKKVVESYLPCFLTDDEISELFPKEDDAYTQQAELNLSFITKYFQNCGKTFNQIGEVQEEFGKSKVYLELKNSDDFDKTEEILEKGGYLEEIKEDDVFKENAEEFFAHFDLMRKDDNNPILSDEAVVKAIKYAYAMTALNNAKRSEIKNLVGKYNDIYGIDLEADDIENVDEDDLYAVLYNKNYTDKEKIAEDFEEKLKELLENKEEEKEEEQEKKPKPSRGGGGSGGRVVVKTPVNEQLPQPEIAPEEPKKAEFTDIKGHWAQTEIEKLSLNKIINGFEDNTFRPENTITRAELVAMLVRIVPETNAEAEILFSDINENDWFYEAAIKAAAMGIVNGADGKFMPFEAVTREQIATMIFRALNASDKESVIETKFEDSEDISSYAREAIAYLGEKKVISGYPDNTVRPANKTSRAEAAKMLCGAFPEKIK